MKILVLTGSPHKSGTSFHLADQFIKGAEKAGHQIKRYDTAFLHIGGCLGCKYCRKHNDMCVQHDIMDEINKEVLESDMILFVTPIFFGGMSAQLKTVIDRFYAILSKIYMPKKYMFFITCNDKSYEIVNPIIQFFKTFGNNYGWEDMGHILAQGYNKQSEIVGSTYAQLAYDAGENL